MINQTAQPDLADRIRHASSYPFSRPACSYLFGYGQMHPLRRDLIDGRLPVLASGSNAAPERLAAKFDADDGVIPVTRAILKNFSVVFAGHFTGYGAIPATLAPSPNARALVWITWLTEEQLMIMHRSEGVVGCREVEQRYDYVLLDDLDLHPEGCASISKAGAYLSRRMLAPQAQPVRFAEVSSRHCSFQAWPERLVLRQAHQFLLPAASFSAFMSKVLSGADQRQVLFEKLTPHTIKRQQV